MKSIKFLSALILSVFLSWSFISCGEDTTVNDVINTVLHPVSTNIKKTDNQIVGTASALGMFTYTVTADFVDGKCTNCVGVLECKASFVADAFAKVFNGYERNGNTLVFDYTSKVKGKGFSDVEKVITDLLNTIKSKGESILS